MQRANNEQGTVGHVAVSREDTSSGSLAHLRSLPQFVSSSLVQEGEEISFQQWLDIMPDALIAIDAAGTIALVNHQSETLFGYTREELVGQPLELLLPERLHDAHVQHRKRYAASPHIRPMGAGLELYGRRKDGTEVPVDISLSPLRFDDAFYAMAAIRDITERKLLEEHKVREQHKDDFISMASHELKTPLTCLVAYIDLLHLLLERENNTQAIHYIKRADTQITKLTKLIADFLDISKAQAGKLVFTEKPVVIDDLVREEVELFQSMAPRHHLLIEGATSCQVIGDRDRLGQVLINLLSNAVKYSPQANQIVVRLVREASEVIISIQDFGIGIPASDQERIFERFYRVSINHEQHFPGLGIGLYISYEIIRYHGGRIWVESVEGQGSTFSFALPL